MREFLKPWRRKIGVCTLVLACVFMAGWMRNENSRFDLLALTGKWLRLVLFSFDGRIHFNLLGTPGDGMEFVQFEMDMNRRGVLGFKKEESGLWSYDPLPTELYDVESKCEYFGFHLSKSSFRKNGNFLRIIIIPYWSLVAPLTLLSAFLLISKPKTSSQKRIDEPNANEEATS